MITPKKSLRQVFFLFLFSFFSLPSFALLDWEEMNIPMSDDSSLKGDVYLPEDWTTGPVILIQTPYNKNLYHIGGLPLGIGYNQETMEYAIVIADWRGFWGSAAAAYAGSPTRGEDGYSTVQWIASQSWCDGNVGTWGPSALGNVQYQTAAENPPNLKCIAPQVASPQFAYSDYYTGGVLRTEFVEQLDNLGFGVGPVIISNPYYNLAWMIAEDLNFYPEDIQVPALMIGGWYDHNVEGMVEFFAALQTSSPEAVQDKHKLLMGPWAHGGSGTASVGSTTQGQLEFPEAEGWSDDTAWEFFDFYLKGMENGWEELPPVSYFQMGSNEWLEASSWPPTTTAFDLYFHEGGVLNSSLPSPQDESAGFEYFAEDPSPTIGGPTLRPDLEQGPFDQAPGVESRNDILVFTTYELPEDVVMKGAASVFLNVSSDQLDTDFMVRLCDVYPDGRSMLVCDGAFRMRFKEGFAPADESFMSSGEIYSIEIALPNTAITFLAGHRIRVDITSSNYPRFNRNMNNGSEMYPDANGDMLVFPLIANNTVHLSQADPSRINLPLASDFPDDVKEIVAEEFFDVFPNPANDIVHVDVKGISSSPYTLKIIDMTGRCVAEKKITSFYFDVDVSGFSPGVYFFSVVSGKGIVTQSVGVQ